ncbi:MAG: agmatine deiminase family protein, partial [Vicinamibacteria bacterium]
MLKAMLPLIPRRLGISLGVVKAYDEELFRRASDFHFPDTIHDVAFRNGETDLVSPWVQDYLKSGTAGRDRRILVTRLLYEGSAENGVLFRPLLDSLREERFVRSKLSWEGGDLQFVRHPRDPEKTVLFYGNAGKNYWARLLTAEEYRYVLKLEFGAEEAVRLSDLAPHVDYFISFIPNENIALVSEAERGNIALALGALRALRERFGDAAPPSLGELERLLSLPESEIRKNVGAVKRALQQAKNAEWPDQMDPALGARIQRYVEQHCPRVQANCMSLVGRRKMLAEDPELFRDWTTAGWAAKSQNVFVPYSLALVESQLPGFPNRLKDRMEEKVGEVEALGFRVIRVPRVSGEADLGLPWAGISYVNNLLVDNLLFVPAFGLGPAEDQIFERLERALPEPYRVIPIFSRHMILYNGGVHCIVGIVRTPEPSSHTE